MVVDRFSKLSSGILLAVLLIVGLYSLARAESPLEEEARAIASALQCPVCSGQSVNDSPAPLAVQMRDLIRKKLAQGDSQEQILSYFVDRYGEAILREPPGSGFNQLLRWLPVLALLAGLGVLGLALYRWKSGHPDRVSVSASGMPLEDLSGYERRFEKELRDRQLGVFDSAGESRQAKEGLVSQKAQSRGPGSRSEAVGRKSKAPSSSGKGPGRGQRRDRLNARSATSKLGIRNGSAIGRWGIVAAGSVVGLALLAAVIGWPYLGTSDARAQAAKPIAVLGTQDVHALAFSPSDPNVVFFGHHDGLMRSDDGGRTWRPLVARRGFDAMSLAIHPAAPDVIFAAGHEVFSRSLDGGNTWQPVANDLPHDDIHAFAVDAKDTKTLYAFVVGYGLYRSENGGSSWKIVGDRLTKSITALATAADNPRMLYAGSVEGGVLRSADGGGTWQQASNGVGNAKVLSLATSPAAPGLVYAGTDSGLLRSIDGGATWQSTGLHVVATAVAVPPGNPRIVLVVDRETKVYRSEDGGATWATGQ